MRLMNRCKIMEKVVFTEKVRVNVLVILIILESRKLLILEILVRRQSRKIKTTDTVERPLSVLTRQFRGTDVLCGTLVDILAIFVRVKTRRTNAFITSKGV